MAAGRREGREPGGAESCPGDALLFATLCLIGLHVDVHIKDGSIYSGTFYTASVDKKYGIVLKGAKLTKKGKCSSSINIGDYVDTLIVFSQDFSQIVAREVMNPTTDTFENMINTDELHATTHIPSSSAVEVESNGLKEHSGHAGILNNARETENGLSHMEKDLCLQNHYIHDEKMPAGEAEISGSDCSSITETSSNGEWKRTESCQNLVAAESLNNQIGGCNAHFSSERDVSSIASATAAPISDHTSELEYCSSDASADSTSHVAEKVSVSQAFKLNPDAQKFIPSYAKTAPWFAYGQRHASAVPFYTNSAPPAKLATYVYPVVENTCSGPVSSHSIGENPASRLHPPQYPGQYPVSQSGMPQVMLGRMGQLVYLQPVPQELVHGIPAATQLPSGALVTPRRFPYPKHGQGMCQLNRTPATGAWPASRCHHIFWACIILL